MSNLYVLSIINESGQEADYSIDCVYEDIPPVTVRDRDNWMTVLNLNQHYIPITVSVLPQDGSSSVSFVLAKNGKGARGDVIHSPGNKVTVEISNNTGTPL